MAELYGLPKLTPGQGWALNGRGAHTRTRFTDDKTFSALGAVSQNGFAEGATDFGVV